MKKETKNTTYSDVANNALSGFVKKIAGNAPPLNHCEKELYRHIGEVFSKGHSTIDIGNECYVREKTDINKK